MDTDWRGELEDWLTPFVAALRHKTRSRMCPAYIAGLIGPGDRIAHPRRGKILGTVSNFVREVI